MKLYYARQTRAARPRWMLEELGVPYELVRLDLSKGEHKKPEYLKIHPHGSVPALIDGDVRMFESAAICAYLADKFPEKGFAPAPGAPERAYYYQWLVYAMATAEPPILKIFLNTRMLPEAQRSPAVAEEGRKQWADVARVLEQSLAGKSFLVGERFSAADVMIGSMLGWARSLRLLEGHRGLEEYTGRLTGRPAFERANAD